MTIDKEIISNLNNDNLEIIKGGTNDTSKLTACIKPTDKSDCCTFASYGICASKNEANCNNKGSIGYGVQNTACLYKPNTVVTTPASNVNGNCTVNVVSQQLACFGSKDCPPVVFPTIANC